jgi:sugar (glycoside-pentoside-hexuronide) transporter
MADLAEARRGPTAEELERAPERLPRKVVVTYGMLEMSSTCFFNMAGFYLLYFLTDTVGISPSTASIVFTAAIIWDAVTDPAMGVISDRTRSRYGRRRPYVLAAAIPFCVCGWLLFTTPPLSGPVLVAYFVVIALLLHTFSTVLYVPFTALLPEMTTDYDERTSLATSRTLWANIGGSFGGALPLLLVAQFTDPKIGWSVTAGIFALFCIFPILATWRGTRGWERHAADTEPLDVEEILGALIGNRSFRYVAGIYLFGICGLYASMSAYVYFLQYVMGFSETEVSTFFIYLYVVSVVTVPIAPFLSRQIGKRMSCVVLLSIWALGVGTIVMVIQPGQTHLLYVMGFFSAAGANAVYQLCWAMIPDVVEVDELKTGKRREGTFQSVADFVMKLGSALSVFLVGQALALMEYVPNAIQSASTLLGLRMLNGLLLAVLVSLAVMMALAMPMTRSRHKALLSAIEAKKKGQPWDGESIEKLM